MTLILAPERIQIPLVVATHVHFVLAQAAVLANPAGKPPTHQLIRMETALLYPTAGRTQLPPQMADVTTTLVWCNKYYSDYHTQKCRTKVSSEYEHRTTCSGWLCPILDM